MNDGEPPGSASIEAPHQASSMSSSGAVEDYDGDRRLAELVAPPLERARQAGRVAAGVTVDDVALALRMIYGAAATARDGDQRRLDVEQAHAVVTAPWF